MADPPGTRDPPVGDEDDKMNVDTEDSTPSIAEPDVSEPPPKKLKTGQSKAKAVPTAKAPKAAPVPKVTKSRAKARPKAGSAVSKAAKGYKKSSGDEDGSDQDDTDEDGSDEEAKDEAEEDRVQQLADGESEGPHVNKKSRPLFNIKDIFHHMVHRFLALVGEEDGLKALIEYLDNRPIHIATICSGTESPIIALSLVKEVLAAKWPQLALNFEHLFSAEIVAFKQHYIEANFSPPILFSDITELTRGQTDEGVKRSATTAYGGLAEVPGDVDLLVAGFSCVDFSPLNCRKKKLEDSGESGDTFFSLREYAKVYRPKLIILENVSGAPWVHENKSVIRTGLDLLMGQIGYATKHIKADTKKYYLPQTRVRGYMVCVDKMLYLDANVNIADKFTEWNQHPIPGWVLDESTQTPVYRSLHPPELYHWEEGLQELFKDLERWKDLVQTLARKTSVPIDCMLLRSDDPSLEALSTQSNAVFKTKRKDTPWERARISHAAYRDDLRLGHRKMLTQWISGGVHTTEDHWTRSQKGMVDRVLDTLEICHLRSLARGFDNRYYPRPLELSQNVFRVGDTTQPGIIGCLTPSGFPFLSSRGSRIIGLEALMLQGLHLPELDLDMLTQANLQDLAGNAMSSTVVGVVMAVALGVWYKKLNVKERQMSTISATASPDFPAEQLLLKESKLSSAHLNTLPCTEAMAEAQATIRLCTCEGRLHHKSTKFQRCTVCQHTTCKECGVKPEHLYKDVPEEELMRRKDPSIFEKLIRSSIPTSISFHLDDAELHGLAMMVEGVDLDANLNYMAMVKEALQSTVFLRSVRRDEFWEVIYDSSEARLVLIISHQHIEWRLFVNVDDQGFDTPEGTFFRKHPIAKMSPSGDDILVGAWNLLVPQEREFAADLEWTGAPVKSFGNERGLLDMLGDHVYPECKLSVKDYNRKYFDRDINGHYSLSQACSQPKNSLHALQSDGRPLFFYLEQNIQSGGPEEQHYYGFTEDTHRLEMYEYRNFLAEFSGQWRPPLIKITKSKEVEDLVLAEESVAVPEVVAAPETITLPETVEERLEYYDKQKVPELKALLRGRKIPVTGNKADLIARLVKNDKESGKEKRSGEEKKRKATNVLVLRAPDVEVDRLEHVNATFQQRTSIFSRGYWEICDSMSMNRAPGIQLNYQLLPAASTPLPISAVCVLPNLAIFCFEAKVATKITSSWIKGIWTTMSRANESRFMADFGWTLQQGSVVNGHTNADTVWQAVTGNFQCSTCAPQPPPLEWSLVGEESRMKVLPREEPQAATIYEKSMKHRPKGLLAKFFIGDQGEVHFKVAANPLTLAHRAGTLLSSSQSKLEIISDITTSWRLVTDDESNPNVQYAPLTVIQNTHISGEIDMSKFKQTLRTEQLRGVVWMKRRDGGQESFSEEEVVEDRIINLKYRLEAKASRNVFCKGGLLFFDVGFGKTAITLALIQSCFESDTTAANARLQSHPPSTSGKISIKATLIVVPTHLSTQWKSETEKFLGWTAKGRVLVIATLPQLRKLTIQNFMNADIIILNWSLLTGETYQSSLAAFGGIVESDTTSLRVKNLWHDKATDSISTTVRSLYEPGVFPKDIPQKLADRLKADEELCDKINAPMPTKRTRGRNYVSADARRIAEAAQKQKLEPIVVAGQKRKSESMDSEEQDENPTVDQNLEDDDLDETAPDEMIPEVSGVEALAIEASDVKIPDVEVPDEETSKTSKSKAKKTSKVKDRQAKNTVDINKVFGLLTAKDYKGIKSPFLEMFDFARIVIDEFTYLFDDSQVLHIVNKLAGRSKFALSGTPDLAKFSHVKKLSTILGIHLGRDDYESMKGEEFAVATKDLSKSEQFLTYQSAASTAWHINRQGVAQNFLDLFARNDEADIEHIGCVKRYHLINLHPAQKAVYLELQQRVASSTFDVLRSRNIDSAVERQIQDVSSHNDPKGTLLVRASHMKLESEDQVGAMLEAPKATPANKSKWDVRKNTVALLKVELANRELPVSGKRADLITRLEDYDAGLAAKAEAEAEARLAAEAEAEDSESESEDIMDEDPTEFENESIAQDNPTMSGVVTTSEVSRTTSSKQSLSGRESRMKRVRNLKAPSGETESVSDAESDAEIEAKSAIVSTEKTKNAIPEIVPETVSVRGLIAIRKIQYAHFLVKMAKLLKKAFWLQNHEETLKAAPKNFAAWLERVGTNHYHDKECTADVLALIEAAKDAYSENDWQDFYYKKDVSAKEKTEAQKDGKWEYPVGFNEHTNTAHLLQVVAFLRTTTTQLSRDMETIVSHRRSMRLMEAIFDIETMTSQCSKCDEEHFDAADVTILSACGHVMCNECMNSVGDACPLTFCAKENRVFEKVAGSEFEDLVHAEDSSNSRKIDAILDIIKGAIKKKEKVLLFVQFPKLASALSLAMKEDKVKFVDMINDKDKAKTLHEFQSTNNPDSVLMMDPTGQSAAGANLTCCNHVIFTTPLYTNGYNAQYRYKSTEIQGIGRSRRYGQLKTVEVHYMFSVNTIDVDLFQHREGKILQRDPSNPEMGLLIDGAPSTSTLHSSIRHINFPGASMTD